MSLTNCHTRGVCIYGSAVNPKYQNLKNLPWLVYPTTLPLPRLSNSQIHFTSAQCPAVSFKCGRLSAPATHTSASSVSTGHRLKGHEPDFFFFFWFLIFFFIPEPPQKNKHIKSLFCHPVLRGRTLHCFAPRHSVWYLWGDDSALAWLRCYVA